MYYLIIAPIVLILAAAALALPWFMVRQGLREQVQLCCACTAGLGLAAATGVFSYFDNAPLAMLYGAATLSSLLYALDCWLPLYLSRKSLDQ
ncbi:cobalamin biosynthesis protein CbiX [Salmonella enterica subsp. enterica serovar Telelkebir]|nr:cobalamin biosynthesis protein CbiX [Salmonella enterica subsp. enterica serovar Telelkebir]ECB6714037.1 cobalamin biosynthesis protein CbiX [Salmonella enterica subsp. enterica serovar Hvittingfoss]ELT8232703.1 cobalamin biosynthesis protein CbiX [Salmonella enterica]